MLIALILSLPTENATLRQRVWRALKASGAAVLRDGVYLMPDRDDSRATLGSLAAEVRDAAGVANVFKIQLLTSVDLGGEASGELAVGSSDTTAELLALFDRSHAFSALLADIAQARQSLTVETLHDVVRQARKLRKAYAQWVAIDFFPQEARVPTRQAAESALRDLEQACARVMSADEPQPQGVEIARLNLLDYQGRCWATRARPWVDRLASAWLIRRFIDPQARFLWLASPAKCPSDALGFDFDGASFSHVGQHVTFEVLVASFGLNQPAIERVGALVHFLDVGGDPPPEAAGLEQVLAGLRQSVTDDDQLLHAASFVFDGLLASFDHLKKSL